MKFKLMLLSAMAALTMGCDQGQNVCIQHIEDSAQYGYKNESIHKICATQNTQVFVLAGRMQNAFGTWGKTSFTCLHNKNTNTAMLFDGDVGTLFLNLPKDERQTLCAELDATPQQPVTQNSIDTILDEITVIVLNIKTLFVTQGSFASLTNNLCAKVGILPSGVTQTGDHLTDEQGHQIDVAGQGDYFTVSYSKLSATACNQLQQRFHQIAGVYNATLDVDDCNQCDKTTCTITLFAK